MSSVHKVNRGAEISGQELFTLACWRPLICWIWQLAEGRSSWWSSLVSTDDIKWVFQTRPVLSAEVCSYKCLVAGGQTKVTHRIHKQTQEHNNKETYRLTTNHIAIGSIWKTSHHSYLCCSQDTVAPGLSALYIVWIQSDLRPLEPRVWTLIQTGALRSRSSRTHCRNKCSIFIGEVTLAAVMGSW